MPHSRKDSRELTGGKVVKNEIIRDARYDVLNVPVADNGPLAINALKANPRHPLRQGRKHHSTVLRNFINYLAALYYTHVPDPFFTRTRAEELVAQCIRAVKMKLGKTAFFTAIVVKAVNKLKYPFVGGYRAEVREVFSTLIALI